MRFYKFFSGVVGIAFFVLGLCNARAETVPCPAGCFCLNDGKYNNSTGDSSLYCNEKAQPVLSSSSCESNVLNFDGGRIDCVRNLSDNVEAKYFLDEFSELYEGFFGLYGVIDSEIIYMPRNGGSHNMYSCPASYPVSAAGAKSLTDCFKYDANGKKVHYGAKQTIKCSAGTYLPANTTQCASCSASKNHVCPGGKFSKSSTKIQGLKVECYPGQYLPAGAIQCSSCNDDYYLCLGGIYEFNELKSQGRVINNGYVISGNHTVKTCKPGYYMPALSANCTACAEEYVCPGGIFYTDGQYEFARGIVLCAYGHPDSTHTYCVSSNTQPSYMAGKMSMAARMSSALNPQSQSGKNDQYGTLTNVDQNGNVVNVEQQKQTDLETAKKMISLGMPIPPNTPKPVTVIQQQAQQQPEVVLAQKQTDLDTAKKMISLGMAPSAANGTVTTNTQQQTTGTQTTSGQKDGLDDAKKMISAGIITASTGGTSAVTTVQPAIRATTVGQQGAVDDVKKLISAGML